MPKRRRDSDSDDEYFRKKLRKLEKKLKKRRKRSRRSRTKESSTNSSVCESPPARTPTPIFLLSPEPIREHGERSPLPAPPAQHPASHHAHGEFEPPLPSGEPCEQMSCGAQAEPAVAEGRALPSPARTTSDAIACTASHDADDNDVSLDEETREYMGNKPSKVKKYGPRIHKDLVVRWEHIATSGLSKDEINELREKYPVPENCKKIDAPLLNIVVKKAVSETLQKKDAAIENKQRQMSAAISCIGTALTQMFSMERKDTSTIKLLIDAGRLLCDVQYIDSNVRRKFIRSGCNKEVSQHLNETEIDTHLFGENLDESLKAAKAISKVGSELRRPLAPAPSRQPAANSRTRSLNWKPPLPYSATPAVGRRAAMPAPPSAPPSAPPPRAPPRRRAPYPYPAGPPPPPQQQRYSRAPQQRR